MRILHRIFHCMQVMTTAYFGGLCDLEMTAEICSTVCNVCFSLVMHMTSYRYAFVCYRAPSFSSALCGPSSCHSCFVIHMFSLSAMIFARTAPPRKTMCRRRGGSSIRTLNFCKDALAPLPQRNSLQYLRSTSPDSHPTPSSTTTASTPSPTDSVAPGTSSYPHSTQ